MFSKTKQKNVNMIQLLNPILKYSPSTKEGKYIMSFWCHTHTKNPPAQIATAGRLAGIHTHNPNQVLCDLCPFPYPSQVVHLQNIANSGIKHSSDIS